MTINYAKFKSTNLFCQNNCGIEEDGQKIGHTYCFQLSLTQIFAITSKYIFKTDRIINMIFCCLLILSKMGLLNKSLGGDIYNKESHFLCIVAMFLEST